MSWRQSRSRRSELANARQERRGVQRRDSEIQGVRFSSAWCATAYLARGRKTRRGTIQGVGFSPAMLPVATCGSDTGCWNFGGSREGRKGVVGEVKRSEARVQN